MRKCRLAMTSLISKLWDRGVDIGVGAITSLFVAGIVAGAGLLFWKLKLRLELSAEKEKKEQQNRMDDEREAAQRELETQRRHERLTAERENFARSAISAENNIALARLWGEYFNWLRDNGLDRLKRNLDVLTHHSGWTRALESPGSFPLPQVERDRTRMADLIRLTELVDPDHLA